jgi:hypothetical protein
MPVNGFACNFLNRKGKFDIFQSFIICWFNRFSKIVIQLFYWINVNYIYPFTFQQTVDYNQKWLDH